MAQIRLHILARVFASHMQSMDVDEDSGQKLVIKHHWGAAYACFKCDCMRHCHCTILHVYGLAQVLTAFWVISQDLLLSDEICF